MPRIHPSAIVDPAARLADGVRVGPYCVIGAGGELDDGVTLHSHVVVEGRTRIGPRTEIFPFASIGHHPQDLKYRGEASELVIGADNVIREQVTMNPGTAGGGMVTRVGNGCLFMVGAHVAHDCQIGNHVIMANNATLAGHVSVGDHAIIGGLSAVLQFVRIGRYAMIGGMSGVEQDVVPYGLVMGERASLCGLNIVGLKRRNVSREQIQRLQGALESLFADDGTLADRLAALEASRGELELIGDLLDFVGSESRHGFCRPKKRYAG